VIFDAVSTPNPLTTPTSQNYNDKLLLPGAGDGSSTLTSLFISSEFRTLPLVSPDYPARENIANKFASENLASNQKQMSLMVTRQVIEMTDGGFSPRKQPSLVPSPGKISQNFSLGFFGFPSSYNIHLLLLRLFESQKWSQEYGAATSTTFDLAGTNTISHHQHPVRLQNYWENPP
jgi:hypothetical protein